MTDGPHLDQLADDLRTSIGHSLAAICDRPLTLHWPTVGAAFDCGVLVVGQTINGRMNSGAPGEVCHRDARSRVVAEAEYPFADLRDPMAGLPRG